MSTLLNYVFNLRSPEKFEVTMVMQNTGRQTKWSMSNCKVANKNSLTLWPLKVTSIQYLPLVCTTQVNSTFHTHWLAIWKWIASTNHLPAADDTARQEFNFWPIFWYIERNKLNFWYLCDTCWNNYLPPLLWIIIK